MEQTGKGSLRTCYSILFYWIFLSIFVKKKSRFILPGDWNLNFVHFSRPLVIFAYCSCRISHYICCIYMYYDIYVYLCIMHYLILYTSYMLTESQMWPVVTHIHVSHMLLFLVSSMLPVFIEIVDVSDVLSRSFLNEWVDRTLNFCAIGSQLSSSLENCPWLNRSCLG